MIICDNTYCIYWKRNRCRLSEITVDGSGRCGDRILVSLTEEELGPKRRQLLERYGQNDGSFPSSLRSNLCISSENP